MKQYSVCRGKDQADLTRHRRRVHGIDLRYFCTFLCTLYIIILNIFLFLLFFSLYSRTIDDINQHARYKEKKAFPCVNCPKSYSSQYRLNDHKKVCSGASSVLSNNTVSNTTSKMSPFGSVFIHRILHLSMRWLRTPWRQLYSLQPELTR